MTSHSQLVCLQHARDALRSVIEYTKDGQSAFAASKVPRLLTTVEQLILRLAADAK